VENHAARLLALEVEGRIGRGVFAPLCVATCVLTGLHTANEEVPWQCTSEREHLVC
jgi:hypothetical protein